MGKTTELKRINEGLKHYKIKQARIAEKTGFTRCKVSRCLSGIKPKNRLDAVEIKLAAYELIKGASLEVEGQPIHGRKALFALFEIEDRCKK